MEMPTAALVNFQERNRPDDHSALGDFDVAESRKNQSKEESDGRTYRRISLKPIQNY